MFSAQTTAKKTVARSRLRSTIEPPPIELPPPPIPKAPERPASLPECRSTRKIRTTEMVTWMTLRNVYTKGSLALLDLLGLALALDGPTVAVGTGAVAVLDPVEDLDGFLAQFGVDQGEVLV